MRWPTYLLEFDMELTAGQGECEAPAWLYGGFCMCGLGQYSLKPLNVSQRTNRAIVEQCLRVEHGSWMGHDTWMVAA